MEDMENEVTFEPADRVRLITADNGDGPAYRGTVSHVNTYDVTLVTVQWDDGTNSKVGPARLERI